MSSNKTLREESSLYVFRDFTIRVRCVFGAVPLETVIADLALKHLMSDKDNAKQSTDIRQQ